MSFDHGIPPSRYPSASGFYGYTPAVGSTDPVLSSSSLDRITLSYQHVRPSTQKDPFRITQQFAWYDEETGELYVVPHRTSDFTSDLTSVPQLVTWLVPSIGEHLRPALLHDALVINTPAKRPSSTLLQWIRFLLTAAGVLATFYILLFTDVPAPLALAPTIVALVAGRKTPPDKKLDVVERTHLGEPVGRATADRIFRTSMAHDGTLWLRRWLMWAAVTAATHFDPPQESAADKWRGRALVVGTFGAIVMLGCLAIADLADVGDLLPWMGNRPWNQEVISGFAMAVVIPVVMSLAWPRVQTAPILGGVAIALLVPVTVPVGLTYGLYLGLERIADPIHRFWQAHIHDRLLHLAGQQPGPKTDKSAP